MLFLINCNICCLSVVPISCVCIDRHIYYWQSKRETKEKITEENKLLAIFTAIKCQRIAKYVLLKASFHLIGSIKLHPFTLRIITLIYFSIACLAAPGSLKVNPSSLLQKIVIIFHSLYCGRRNYNYLAIIFILWILFHANLHTLDRQSTGGR